jgi:hypothetical protein
MDIFGTFSMKLQVKNVATGAIQTLSFSITLAKQLISSMTLVAPLPTTHYRTGQGTLLIDPPAYTPTPSNGYMSLTYTKTSGPTFVTIQAGPPAKIKILTSIYSQVGSYTVII